LKTLKKKDFVTYLQSISVALDKAEIKHEIPFCHIDKESWNYINIIIPDFISSFDLVKIINMSEYKEKEGIIYSKVDDFDVRFIKASDNLWQYSFYYYSWDILHNLIDTLVSSFSMTYTRLGLFYEYKKMNILITTNLKDIFEFLDLPFHLITNGFATDYVMYSFVEAAEFFNIDLFNMEVFKKDYYFLNNQLYYKEFLNHAPDVRTDENKTIEEKIALIGAFFPKSNFIEKLYRIQMKDELDVDFTKKSRAQKINRNILEEKEKELKIQKKKKKIDLSKWFKTKDSGNDDFSISD